MCSIAITNMTSFIEEENDSDYFDDENSGSETEDHGSQTSDDDDEIDLENLKLNDNSTWQTLYNSKSGMTWSINPNYSTKTNHSNNNVIQAGLTEVTANISSIEDAFLSFMPEKMLKKFYFIQTSNIVKMLLPLKNQKK